MQDADTSPQRGDDVKTGQTKEYEVGGKRLTLKPVTLGKMKKAMGAFMKKDGDAFDMMLDHLTVILDNGCNPFATREWLEDNITLPQANEMVTDMRAMNGLGSNDFFRMGAAPAVKNETRELLEKTPTPSV